MLSNGLKLLIKLINDIVIFYCRSMYWNIINMNNISFEIKEFFSMKYSRAHVMPNCKRLNLNRPIGVIKVVIDCDCLGFLK